MKCTILHESRGRMRVHVHAVRMTLHRADVLEAYLNHQDSIHHATVYERTGDVVLTYTGSRKEAIALPSYISPAMLPPDVDGSYTGVPRETYYEDIPAEPVQDADDL